MRLAEHGLLDEGRAYVIPECHDCRQSWGYRGTFLAWGRTRKRGHGLCQCAAVSEHADNDAARKAWHRQHKAETMARAT